MIFFLSCGDPISGQDMTVLRISCNNCLTSLGRRLTLVKKRMKEEMTYEMDWEPVSDLGDAHQWGSP